MYYVYVLKSRKWNKHYIGVTGDLKSRLKQHNNKDTSSTKNGIPWVVVYYEAYLDEKDASDREDQLKKYKSAYGFLKKRIKLSSDRA